MAKLVASKEEWCWHCVWSGGADGIWRRSCNHSSFQRCHHAQYPESVCWKIMFQLTCNSLHHYL